MSSQLDQILAQDEATFAAVNSGFTQLQTDVSILIGLVQNGDPGALAAAQRLGTDLTTLQGAVSALDTSVQGAEGVQGAAKPVPSPGTSAGGQTPAS